jgi:hypothetical protein
MLIDNQHFCNDFSVLEYLIVNEGDMCSVLHRQTDRNADGHTCANA